MSPYGGASVLMFASLGAGSPAFMRGVNNAPPWEGTNTYDTGNKSNSTKKLRPMTAAARKRKAKRTKR